MPLLQDVQEGLLALLECSELLRNRCVRNFLAYDRYRAEQAHDRTRGR
jgi:hypothetical protein